MHQMLPARFHASGPSLVGVSRSPQEVLYHASGQMQLSQREGRGTPAILDTCHIESPVVSSGRCQLKDDGGKQTPFSFPNLSAAGSSAGTTRTSSFEGVTEGAPPLSCRIGTLLMAPCLIIVLCQGVSNPWIYPRVFAVASWVESLLYAFAKPLGPEAFRAWPRGTHLTAEGLHAASHQRLAFSLTTLS